MTPSISHPAEPAFLQPGFIGSQDIPMMDYPAPGRGARFRRRDEPPRGGHLESVDPDIRFPNQIACVNYSLDATGIQTVSAVARRRPGGLVTLTCLRGNHSTLPGERRLSDVHGWSPEAISAVIIAALEDDPTAWPTHPPGRQRHAAPATGDTDSAAAAAPPDAPAKDGEPKVGRKAPPKPLRHQVIDAVLRAEITFWRDADHTAFATVPIGGRIERYRVRSRAFRIIARQIYGATHRVPSVMGPQPGAVSDAALSDALDAFEAMALAGPIREWGMRSIRYQNAIWVDLGDEEWTLVRITADGWCVTKAADVPLIRGDGMRAMASPVRRADALERLRGFLNVSTETDLQLVVSWMVAALWPSGPYPILALDGEQGAAKSTATRLIVRLVDPSKAPHRACPRDEESLLVAASNTRVLALDNISFIEADIADALCRLAAGAGFGKRRLYSDSDEITFFLARPVVLNGIPNLLARPDVADRALTVTLPTIPDESRRDEGSLWPAIEAAAPGVTALLFDAVAEVMHRLPDIRLPRLPRMADFARLACSAAPVFGWTSESILAALETNRRGIVADVVDADPFAAAVQSLVARTGVWSGAPTALLTALNDITDTDIRRDRAWPKSAAAASGRLKRVVPALRRSGLDIRFAREGGTGRRMIEMRSAQPDRQT